MKKILFIEDESSLQKSIGDMLAQEGYQVVSALEGQKGLLLAEKEKPDLILLDLILPQMDGFEVLDGLKKNAQTKDIPVIVLTNLERIEDVQKVLGVGIKAYLIKTQYSLKEIAGKIKGVIGE